MAQPNANREPTMEEILASIRRIIESNDPASERKPALVGAMADEGGDALEDDIAPPVQVSQTYAPRRTAAPESVAERARPAGRPVSLADVAARVRASGTASALSAPLLRTEGRAAVRIEPDMDIAELRVADGMEDDEDSEDAAAGIRADNDTGEAVAKADDTSEEEAFDSDIRQAMNAAMATEAEPEAAAGREPPVTEAQPADAEPGRQLVSSSTGAKVAAAFEDLSEAFKAEQRRSFDEMAEDMMRPMLQQWLDDNLPTLVERLVREEIERVARGSRR